MSASEAASSGESAITFNLEQHYLTVGDVHHNLPPSSLHEHAIRYERDPSIAENGALAAYSGVKTADRQTERSSFLVGLSGTGKTTLSADPKRDSIADDEHCWGLARLFRENLTKYEAGVSAEIKDVGQA
jgi:ATP-dependent phosphoenolpyruvate carboxykinase